MMLIWKFAYLCAFVSSQTVAAAGVGSIVRVMTDRKTVWSKNNISLKLSPTSFLCCVQQNYLGTNINVWFYSNILDCK